MVSILKQLCVRKYSTISSVILNLRVLILQRVSALFSAFFKWLLKKF